jgi:amidase
MRVAAFFEHHDVLACPTVAVAPYSVAERFPSRINGEPLSSYIDWMYLTFVLTLTGCPAISVPIGLTGDGRPVGLQLLGRPRGDFDLLGAAQLLEQSAGMAAMVPRLQDASHRVHTHATCKWWSRGESNPRPQAITGQFYMRSWLI